MRIAIVSLNTYSRSENDGKLRLLAESLDQLTVINGAFDTIWGTADQSRAEAGFDVISVAPRMSRSPATAYLPGLEGALRQLRPDVIHVESEPWQAVAVQAAQTAKGLKVPLGVQFAENGPKMRGISGQVRGAIGRLVLRRCSYAVGWSLDSTRIARRLAPGILQATFPGTGAGPGTLRSQLDASSETAEQGRIAFVGRLEPEKGVAEFLRLADLVRQERPECEVVIVGDGSQRDLVTGWCDVRAGSSWLGTIDRRAVAELMSVSDLVVCPSRSVGGVREQFSKAAAEAMLVGTPVFAFDCGGLKEVIGGGGVVVPEGLVTDLAAAVVHYFGQSARARARLRQQAAARGQAFSDESVASQLLRLWGVVTGLASSRSDRIFAGSAEQPAVNQTAWRPGCAEPTNRD